MPTHRVRKSGRKKLAARRQAPAGRARPAGSPGETFSSRQPLIQALFDASLVRAALLDRRGIMLAANQPMAEGLGLTVAQVIGRCGFDLVDAAHAKPRRQAFLKALRTGKPVIQEDVRNGRHFHTRYCPVPDEEGRLTRVALFCLDITDTRQAEAEARRYQEHLRSLVAQLCVAEERERRRIAAGLHDGLGHALALTRMKMDELAQAAPSDPVGALVGQAVGFLDEAVRQLRAAVYDLSPPILQSHGLAEATRHLIRTLQGHRPDLKFSLAADGRLKPLPTDLRCFLYRALRELLLNAMKHARARSVEVSVRQVGRRLQLSVRDDGVGFDPRKVLSRGDGAKGFGLSSIRERVHELGGCLEAASGAGRGATVTLEVPLAAGRPRPQA